MFNTPKFSNHNNLHRFTYGVASLLLGAALVGGTTLTAQADTTTAPAANYTLPAANDEGQVVEQQLTQNVTRTVNVTTPEGQTTTTTQTATLQGSQLYDQTHGVVLEGHLDNGHWASVNIPAVKGYQASTQVNAQVVTPDVQDQTVNVNYVKATNNGVKTAANNNAGQAATVATPAAVVENQQAFASTPAVTATATKSAQDTTAEAKPANNHVAGASFGLAGLVATVLGLAGWKKHEN